MNPLIDRRELLRRVAALMGGAVSAPAVLGLLNGCASRKEAEWRPVFFTEAQAAMVAEVAEIMIPRTDTPGAAAVGVPAFIDTMLKDVYPAEDQQRFITGLTEFASQAEHRHGRAFLELEPPQRAAFVQSVHDAAVAEQPTVILPVDKLKRPFILMTKELTLLGYFTSEVGATQVLQYLPIPGAYHGCLPLAQAGNGKTWAVETSRPF